MADRGRKAFPVSSQVCDERWQRHCQEMHKQRLKDIKHQVDSTPPATINIQLNKGKRAMLEKERQYEIDKANTILLQKMVKLKETDTRAFFRPWTARSTFQWKLGSYYDPCSGVKTLDHVNLTSSMSPRSIHYYAGMRPGTAPPEVATRNREMQIQEDNTKLLRAITTMKATYSVDHMERRHAEESVMVQRISNYRGPEEARYVPPGRATSTPRSPYLTGRPGSVGRPPRPSPSSQQRYYEEAQSHGIPAPIGRGEGALSRGGSRAGSHTSSRPASREASGSDRQSFTFGQAGSKAPPAAAASQQGEDEYGDEGFESEAVSPTVAAAKAASDSGRGDDEDGDDRDGQEQQEEEEEEAYGDKESESARAEQQQEDEEGGGEEEEEAQGEEEEQGGEDQEEEEEADAAEARAESEQGGQGQEGEDEEQQQEEDDEEQNEEQQNEEQQQEEEQEDDAAAASASGYGAGGDDEEDGGSAHVAADAAGGGEEEQEQEEGEQEQEQEEGEQEQEGGDEEEAAASASGAPDDGEQGEEEGGEDGGEEADTQAEAADDGDQGDGWMSMPPPVASTSEPAADDEAPANDGDQGEYESSYVPQAQASEPGAEAATADDGDQGGGDEPAPADDDAGETDFEAYKPGAYAQHALGDDADEGLGGTYSPKAGGFADDWS